MHRDKNSISRVWYFCRVGSLLGVLEQTLEYKGSVYIKYGVKYGHEIEVAHILNKN